MHLLGTCHGSLQGFSKTHASPSKMQWMVVVLSSCRDRLFELENLCIYGTLEVRWSPLTRSRARVNGSAVIGETNRGAGRVDGSKVYRNLKLQVVPKVTHNRLEGVSEMRSALIFFGILIGPTPGGPQCRMNIQRSRGVPTRQDFPRVPPCGRFSVYLVKGRSLGYPIATFLRSFSTGVTRPRSQPWSRGMGPWS